MIIRGIKSKALYHLVQGLYFFCNSGIKISLLPESVQHA